MAFFRRSQAQAEPDGSGDSAPPVAPGPPAPAAPAPPPVREAAWRNAPAMPLGVQRSVAVLDAPRFEASLTSHRSPAQLAPLGHFVTDDAPAGVLTDLPTSVAEPTAIQPAGPAADVAVLPVPPPPAERAPAVQRQAAALTPPTPSPAPTPTASSAPTAIAPEPTVTHVAPPEPVVPIVEADTVDLAVLDAAPVETAADTVAPRSSVDAAAPVAVQRAAEAPTLEATSLDSSATNDVDSDPATSASSIPAPELPVAAPAPVGPTAPVIQRSPTTDADAVHPAPIEAPEPAPPAPGLGRPIATSTPVGSHEPDVAPLVGATPTNVQRSTDDAAPPPTLPARRPTGGLGPPQSSIAGGPAIQRVRAGQPTPTLSPALGPPSAPVAPPPAPTPAPAAPVRAPFTPLTAEFAPPEPITIARRAADGPIDAVVPTTPEPVEPAVPKPTEPAAGDVVAPLVGETDLAAVTPWPDTDTGEGPAAVAPPAAEAPATPIRHAEPPALPPVVTSLPRVAAVPPAVQRQQVSAPTPGPQPSTLPTTSARPAPPVTPQLLATTTAAAGPSVGVQRLATASLPVAAPAAASTGPSAGDVAVATGLGHPADDGSIVFLPPPGEAAHDGAVDRGPGEIAVQRSIDVGPTAYPSYGSAAVTSPPSLQLVAGGASAAPGAAGGSPEDLDELARRLYGRIRGQLRRELMIDRERAGNLIEVPR